MNASVQQVFLANTVKKTSMIVISIIAKTRQLVSTVLTAMHVNVHQRLREHIVKWILMSVRCDRKFAKTVRRVQTQWEVTTVYASMDGRGMIVPKTSTIVLEQRV
jgi:hypothetical protein